MKNVMILVILLIPFASFAQCPQLLNTSPENSLWLVPKVQEIFGYELKRIDNPIDRSKIFYRDSLNYTNVNIYSKSEVKYDGIKKVEGELLVKNITIFGPVDKAKLFFEYLKATLKNCSGFKTAGQWIKTNGIGIVWYDLKSEDGVPLYRINIEIEK